MAGIGYFAGIGFNGQVSHLCGNLPTYGEDIAGHVEGNAGFGPSGGFSVDSNRGSTSAGKGLKGGAGYGVMLGVGVSQTVTIATPALW